MGEKANVNKIDNRIFWSGQYMMGALWIIFAIANFFSFNISNFTVCVIGAVISKTNTMGYIKCDKNHQKGVSSFFFKKAAANMSSEQIAKAGMFAMKNGSSISSVVGEAK